VASLRIQRVRIADLVEFARAAWHDTAFKRVLPIPEHLALAHANNPYAEPDDISLIVAYVGSQCAGHTSLVPALMGLEGRLVRIHWGSGYFVAPEFRATGAGMFLLKDALAIDRGFFGVDPSNLARRVWQALGLLGSIGPLTYCTLDPGRTRLSPSSPCREATGRVPGGLGSRIRGMVGRIQVLSARRLLRRAYWSVLLRRHEALLAAHRVRQVHAISRGPDGGGAESGRTRFHRGLEWVNWRLAFPWIKTGGGRESEYSNYYFDAARKVFRIEAVELYSPQDGSYEGFSLFSVSRSETCVVKILDWQLRADVDVLVLLVLALQMARKWGADRIECPQEIYGAVLQDRLVRRIQAPRQRLYIARPTRDCRDLSGIGLDYCDGDPSFT
jgi:hypothetical protein